MAIAGIILLAPTVLEIGVTVQIWATGKPARSISFAIVAPQRVQVPQVEVRMTAVTPSASSCLPISVPKTSALPTEVPVPVVE